MRAGDTAGHADFSGELGELFEELPDVLEVPIDRGKANKGHVVQPAQLIHDGLADHPGQHLALAGGLLPAAAAAQDEAKPALLGDVLPLVTKVDDPAQAPSAFMEEATDLAERFSTVRDQITKATGERRYAEALKLVAQQLGAPIDRFFDEVFVMVDDANVRDNRLRLLGEIADTVNGIAHFHQLGTKLQGRDPSLSA